MTIHETEYVDAVKARLKTRTGCPTACGLEPADVAPQPKAAADLVVLACIAKSLPCLLEAMSVGRVCLATPDCRTAAEHGA